MNRGLGRPAAVTLALTLIACACAPSAPAPTARGEGTASPAQSAATSPVLVGELASASPVRPTPRPSPTVRPVPATLPPATATRRVAAALQRALDESRAAISIPGISATIVFPDGSAWTGVSGSADLAGGRQVTADTAFSIASISKTFVAALALELSAEGAFGLEDQVDRYLPGLGLAPGITVRMLLDHTSGLHDYFLNPKIDAALQSQPSRAWTPAQALRFVGRPYFPPGTGWRYSNTNYLVLGLLIEEVTGRPLADLLRSRFLDPLGLEATFYQGAEQPPGPLAHGYRLTGMNLAKLRTTDLADGSGIAPFRSVVTAAAGAGSLAATSRDVADWAVALYDGDAISQESRALMLSGVADTAGYRPRVPYGLGVQAVPLDGRQAFGHSGRFLGFRAVMRWLPEERVAIAVLTNQSRHDPGPIAARLVRIALPEPGRCPCPAPG